MGFAIFRLVNTPAAFRFRGFDKFEAYEFKHFIEVSFCMVAHLPRHLYDKYCFRAQRCGIG